MNEATSQSASPTSTGAAQRRGWPNLKPTLRRVGSLKLGVVLMIAIGVAMAVATVYESRHSRADAQMLFYQAWWFSLLLVALAVNVLAATLARWPFPLRRVGFPITHLGILVVLGGALITNRFGLEGQLRLAEGTASDEISIPRLVVAVESDEPTHPGVEVDVPMNPVRPRWGIGSKASVGAAMTLVFRDYLPNSQWERRYEPADIGPAAVELQVAVGHDHEPLTYWLTPTDNTVMLGTLPVELMPAKSAAERDRLLSVSATRGIVWAKVGSDERAVDVSAAMESPQAISGEFKVRVTAYYPDAVVGEERKLESRSDRPSNPAIEYEIIGPKGTERRVGFAKFPEFSRMHRGSNLYSEVDTKFLMSASEGGGASLRLVLLESALHFRVTGESGKLMKNGTVKIGELLANEQLGLPLRVTRFLPHGRAIERPVYVPPAEQEGEIPAVRVTIRSGNESSDLWLGWQRPERMAVSAHGYTFTLRHSEHRLPFRVRLDDFERKVYPGTNQAAMFSSHVTLLDDKGQACAAQLISMNQPLQFAGFTFFQSGFESSGARQVSILTVSRDPGKWCVYVGFGLVCVGVVLMAISKKARPSSSALVPDGAAVAQVAGARGAAADRYVVASKEHSRCSA